MFNKITIVNRIFFNLAEMLKFFSILFGIDNLKPSDNTVFSAKYYFHKAFPTFLQDLFGKSIKITSNVNLKKNPYQWFKDNTEKILKECPLTVKFLADKLVRTDYILNVSKKDIESMKEYKDVKIDITNDNVHNYNRITAIEHVIKTYPNAILADFIDYDGNVETIGMETMKFILKENAEKNTLLAEKKQNIIDNQEIELQNHNEMSAFDEMEKIIEPKKQNNSKQKTA